MRKVDFAAICLPRNRGLLLDLVIFVVQILMFAFLAQRLATIAHLALAGNVFAKASMAVFCLFVTILSPIGALLKRHTTRQRNPNFDSEFREVNAQLKGWSVAVYLGSQLMFLIFASVLANETAELLFGKSYLRSLFLPLFFFLPMLALINTAIFVFYFVPSRERPLFRFQASPQADLVGDCCLFLNMILFQMLWGYLMTDLTHDESGLGSRFFTFGFTALFIYFPPRLLYLAEDAKQPRTWWLMVFANLPTIVRLIFAS
jgi:hypothetical protein